LPAVSKPDHKSPAKAVQLICGSQVQAVRYLHIMKEQSKQKKLIQDKFDRNGKGLILKASVFSFIRQEKPAGEKAVSLLRWC
jgi:hypothetical protein